MFGFGLKDKSKKILNEHFNKGGGWTPSWLNSIVSQGKSQGYNEYDVAVWYLITEWQWLIDMESNKETESGKENKKRIYHAIQKEIELTNKIKHLAHQDTGFEEKIDAINKSLKYLMN